MHFPVEKFCCYIWNATVNDDCKLLIFSIANQQCALPLSKVERIIRSVEIKPVPKAPEIVAGIINLHGRAVALLDIRKLFRLADSPMTLESQIIIAQTATRQVALLVDSSTGVSEYRPEEVTAADEVYPGIANLDGVMKLHGGIVYIYDIDRFLSLEETALLDRLLPPGIQMSEMDAHE
jgi:purine-binding chemotaxis protein CheW